MFLALRARDEGGEAELAETPFSTSSAWRYVTVDLDVPRAGSLVFYAFLDGSATSCFVVDDALLVRR